MKSICKLFSLMFLSFAVSLLLSTGCAQPITSPPEQQEEGKEHSHGEGKEHSHGDGGEYSHGEGGEHSHGEGGEHSHGEGGEHSHGDGGEHSHGDGGEHSHGEGGEHSRGEGGEHGGEGRGEHSADHEGGGEGGGEGEEDGTELGRADKYEATRHGAHLVLGWDQDSQSFKGTVKNVTDKTLERVRVEIHLAKRSEVGPTKPVNLKPGESMPVSLTPETRDFHRWSTHAEVGNEEHSHGEGHSEKEGGEGGGHTHGEGGEHAHGDGHGEGHSEGRGEHAADHEGGGEGEEDGTELRRNEKYDDVRNGAHLVLAWDDDSQSFKGTVKNTTDTTLERVRVEIHLSKRSEVGPTKPVNLKPGESIPVSLTPETKNFHRWSTHAEVGNEEHTHGQGHSEREHGEHGERGEHGEGSGKHGGESGEHDG